jgi:sarcosine oxidase subunit delta
MPDELGKTDAEAIHMRTNQAGRQSELWQHVYGCRTWLVVDRDTRTNTVFGVTPVRKAK